MTVVPRMAAGPTRPLASAKARDPLDIATGHYFHKPMAGLFRSFELRAYIAAGVELRPPVLDLGCGDGTFGRMLGEALSSDVRLTGIDLDHAAIRRARRVSADRYHRLVCGSAESLPFESGEFRTIICNGSFGCGAGTQRGLDEAARVLAPGGSLYCTMPTTLFDRNYWLVRVLEGSGLAAAARAYAKRMNRRITHVCCLSPDQWRVRLAAHGMSVQLAIGLFPARLVTPWSVLAASPLRILGLLSVPPFDLLAAAGRSAQRRLFGPLYRRTPVRTPPDDCAYILFHATRDAVTHLRTQQQLGGKPPGCQR